jgi:hypothetical protein
MKNKLFFHILIDLCIAFSLLFLDGLRRKRKEVKKLCKKLDDTQSSIQAIEFSVELLGERYNDLSNSVKSLRPNES